jgi:hypothetical protein
MARYKKATVILLLAAIALTAPAAEIAGSAGSVTVAYTVSRTAKIASNQYAVWIEDGNGRFIKTLFVTNFAGKRAGWKIRPQTLPIWQEAANVKALAQNQVDAVSGATQKNGKYSVTWDLRDANGDLVPDGDYRYLVEGSIFWENRVLWTGTIIVGSESRTTRAVAAYSPADAAKEGLVISDVSATYVPAKR